jgi:integrase
MFELPCSGAFGMSMLYKASAECFQSSKAPPEVATQAFDGLPLRGFRRSELAGIDICDLKFSADGVVVTVRKSKTDQEGAGREVGLPFGASQDTCPVRSLRQWLDRAGITDGPVFRAVGRYGHVSRRGLHSDSIGKLLKRAAARAGMNVEPLGGHSLRAGCVTQAAMNGVREFVIVRQTGHKTIATLRRYIRTGEIFRENAAAGLGI